MCFDRHRKHFAKSDKSPTARKPEVRNRTESPTPPTDPPQNCDPKYIRVFMYLKYLYLIYTPLARFTYPRKVLFYQRDYICKTETLCITRFLKSLKNSKSEFQWRGNACNGKWRAKMWASVKKEKVPPSLISQDPSLLKHCWLDQKHNRIYFISLIVKLAAALDHLTKILPFHPAAFPPAESKCERLNHPCGHILVAFRIHTSPCQSDGYSCISSVLKRLTKHSFSGDDFFLLTKHDAKYTKEIPFLSNVEPSGFNPTAKRHTQHTKHGFPGAADLSFEPNMTQNKLFFCPT